MIDPFLIFSEEITKAKEELPDTWNNMALATATTSGIPSARYVLLKQYNKESGLIFFTNYTSRKSREILENNNVALLFYWPSRGVQIRIEGIANQVEDGVSDKYFSQREHRSKLGAWASKQSSIMVNDDELNLSLESITNKFETMDSVPRPSFWGGYRVSPRSYEFWYQGDNRLHKRELFRLEPEKNGTEKWIKILLYP